MPELALLTDAARNGGAPLAAVFCALWWLERRDNRRLMVEMARKLDKLSTALLLIREHLK